MARVLVAAQTTPGAYPALQPAANSRDVGFQASDTGLGNYTPIVDGKTLVLITNINAAPQTVTFQSVPDTLNREGDITAYSLTQYEVALFGPFKNAGWLQTGTVGLWIDTSDNDVKIAVITLP